VCVCVSVCERESACVRECDRSEKEQERVKERVCV